MTNQMSDKLFQPHDLINKRFSLLIQYMQYVQKPVQKNFCECMYKSPGHYLVHRTSELAEELYFSHFHLAPQWLLSDLASLRSSFHQEPENVYIYVTGSAKIDHLVPAIEIEIAQ